MNLISIRIGLSIILIVCSGFSLSAQTTYHSPYSVYGVGTLMNRSSSLNRGMSFTGIAVRDTLNLNHVNPASYVSITAPKISKIFEFGTFAERNSYETTSSREAKGAGGLTNLSYWFKPSSNWACVLGLNPFSGMSYSVSTNRQLATVENAQYLYEGSGTLSMLHFGNAFKVTRNFSAGINLSYLFGTLEKTETVDAADFTKLMYVSRVFTNKADLDIGLQYGFQWKGKSITLGFIASNGLALDGIRRGNLYTASEDTLASFPSDKVHYKLPPAFGWGMSLHSKRSTLALDTKLTKWSRASFEDQPAKFNDTWRISAGYIYEGNRHGLKLIDFVSVRAGLFYENYYLTLKNKNLANYGFTAGLSVPVLDGKSSIGFTYGNDRFGTSSNGLILQRSHRFMLDIVIRDIWGAKRRFE
jgi:hypothetical protein